MSFTVLLGAVEQGFIYSLVALGLFLSYRTLDVADLTTDGSFTLGAACSAVLTIQGQPAAGLLLALAAGALAGLVTALLQTRLGVQPILAGIVTMTGLYTVNLMVMGGRSNLNMLREQNVFTAAEAALGPMGKLLLVVDLSMLLAVSITFRSLESAMYGIIALYISTVVMDSMLYGLDKSKVAYIISDKWQEIAGTLMDRQGRGVTILQGEGGYTGDEKRVLLVAFKQKEIVDIKRQVHELDEGAFLIVCDARDVLGEGFGEYRQDEI